MSSQAAGVGRPTSKGGSPRAPGNPLILVPFLPDMPTAGLFPAKVVLISLTSLSK